MTTPTTERWTSPTSPPTTSSSSDMLSFPNMGGSRGANFFPGGESRTRPNTTGAMLSGQRVSSYSVASSAHQQNLNDVNPPPYETPRHRRNFTDTNHLINGNSGSNGQYRHNFSERTPYSTQVIRGNRHPSAPRDRNSTGDGHYSTKVANGRIKRKEVDKPGNFWEKMVDTALAAHPKRGLVVGFVWDDMVAAAFGRKRMRPGN